MTSSSAGWGLLLWAKQLSQLILSTRHGQLLIHVLVFILGLSLRTGSTKICGFQPAAENNICASRFWSCLVEAQSSELPAAQSWRSSEPNAGTGTSAAPRGHQPAFFRWGKIQCCAIWVDQKRLWNPLAASEWNRPQHGSSCVSVPFPPLELCKT